jgi:hypothetical protein
METVKKNTQEIGYNLGEKTVTVTIGSQIYTHPVTSGIGQKLVAALSEGVVDDKKIVKLVTRASQVADYAHGANGHLVAVKNDRVYFDGKVIDGAVVRDILKFLERGLPVQPLVNYLIRIRNNPSYRSIEALYEFREANDLPVTADGFVLAYKAINADWFDKYTGKTYLNKPGKIIKCGRNEVVDDPDVACGRGLHVGGISYVLGYAAGVTLQDGAPVRLSEDSSRIVQVKIDPANVVSVPKDSAAGKCRVCEYKVLSEMTKLFDPDLEVAEDEEVPLRG